MCFSSTTEGWTFQLYADLGTHSAHCAVVLRLLLCNDRCPGWGVHKLWIPAVAVSLGSRNAWFDYGYLFCIIQGGFWKNFYDFPRDWVDSDPGVNSRRSLHTWPMRKWSRSSSIMAVAVYWFCLWCTSRCVPILPATFFFCSRAALGNLYIISTSPLVFSAFFTVEILR